MAKKVKSALTGEPIEKQLWKAVKEFESRVAKPEEKNAIATMLSNMDSDLAALGAKLSKSKLLKQDMMQVLLIGTTTLIQNNDPEYA